ncbi:hypothetical protein [Kordiimonas aquimaris]|uniref:hypothetical protein n=1 Tax=Kordiimonas aquimaris TaxID=707591 RepID=UPI0021D2A3FC|nr:hypothetical protein [Kordiimonas aquimaris]
MNNEHDNTQAVKGAIDALIAAGTSFDVDQLELIYHNDLVVVMLDPNGNVNEANKEAFKGLFQSKRDNGDPPLNTWADFHHISADAVKGHVVLTRKVKLMADEQTITLSIDLVFEDERWQVTREVIFVHPENG